MTFVTKVADLLVEPGKKDEIPLDGIQLPLEGLTQEGVTGKIVLESLSKEALLARLYDLYLTCDDMCDSCGKQYMREVWCDYFETKYTLDTQHFVDEALDELFPLAENGEINLEDFLLQAIGLQTPIKKQCVACINQESDDDDDEYLESEVGGVVRIHK